VSGSLFSSPGYRNSWGPLLAGRGPVSEALRQLEANLDSAHVPHIFIGRVATNAYGHARMTDDLDVCVRATDMPRCEQALADAGCASTVGRGRRFLDARTGVTVDLVVSGRTIGPCAEQQTITFPQPEGAEIHAGIPVPSLARLIEVKLARWRFKDWGDVVELIRELDLPPSFSDQLAPSVRVLYANCWEQRIEEDCCNPETHDQPAGDKP
jgi:hypothetical protein